MKLFITKASTDSRFSGLGSMLTALKISLDDRFSRFLEDTNMILGTFLDPRYKDDSFQNSDEASETSLTNIKKKLQEVFEKRRKIEVNKEEPATSNASSNVNPEVELEWMILLKLLIYKSSILKRAMVNYYYRQVTVLRTCATI